MIFSYTAVNARNERLTETLEAADLSAARQELMQRGLFVLKLEQGQTSKQHRRRESRNGVGTLLLGSLAARAHSSSQPISPAAPHAKPVELMLFARQMAMMQQAGAPIVPSLRTLREQPGRASWHALLDDLADNVEGGMSLHEALAQHQRYFSGTFTSIIAAGEATGSVADSFARLAALSEARQRVRKQIISALLYPCVLLFLAMGVVVTMTTFVLPRFATLFEMLDAELPTITTIMLGAAGWLKTGWPVVLGLPLAAIIMLVIWLRTRNGRQTLQLLALRVPLLGRIVAGTILSRLLLVWGAMLRSHVSVLDAVRQAREVTSHVVFVQLIADIELAISEGRSINGVMKQAAVVPPPVVSAVAVGEDSGRLGESLDFVGKWLEEETNTLIAQLTRTLEPAILIFMGLVVGAVCVSLFLPLFDIATAAG